MPNNGSLRVPVKIVLNSTANIDREIRPSTRMTHYSNNNGNGGLSSRLGDRLDTDRSEVGLINENGGTYLNMNGQGSTSHYSN